VIQQSVSARSWAIIKFESNLTPRTAASLTRTNVSQPSESQGQILTPLLLVDRVKGYGLARLHMRAALQRRGVAGAEHWVDEAVRAAEAAIECQGLPSTYAPDVAALALGLVEVESNFGRGPRFQLKQRLAPFVRFLNSRGVGQVTIDRARYLAAEFGLAAPTLRDLNSREFSLRLVSLGVCKALGVYGGTLRTLDSTEVALACAVTHHAGFMTPQVAAIQSMLNAVNPLSQQLPLTGVAGPRTYRAMECFVRRAPRSAASWKRFTDRRNALTDPECAQWFFSLPHGSMLLEDAESRSGRRYELYRIPSYSFRAVYSGRIDSMLYARSAIELWLETSRSVVL